MYRANVVDEYHESDLGDIYDLYNVCNGETREDGRLDPARLDALSPAAAAAAALDVARLREVWRHAADCRVCANIVRTLNLARRALRTRVDERPEEKAPALKPEHAGLY